MTTLFAQASLFAVRWKCFEPECSGCHPGDGVPRVKSGFRQDEESPGTVHLPPVLVADLLPGIGKCPDSFSGRLHLCETKLGFLDTGISASACFKKLADTLESCRTDVSDHPSYHCFSEPDQGPSESHARPDAAFRVSQPPMFTSRLCRRAGGGTW